MQKEEFLDNLEKYARENWIPVILRESLDLIRVMLSVLKPNAILEVGTAIGYSSSHFADFLSEDGYIDTLEISEDAIKMAKANIEELGLQDKINIIQGDATESIKSLYEANKKYDFIFIDGPKSKYIEHFDYALKMLNDGGMIIVDNVEYKGMVSGETELAPRKKTLVRNLRTFLNKVSEYENINYSLLPKVGDGLLLVTKKV